MIKIKIAPGRVMYDHSLYRYTGPYVIFPRLIFLDSFKEELYVQIIYDIKRKCEQNTDMSEN
jgi:hypothetical protein